MISHINNTNISLTNNEGNDAFTILRDFKLANVNRPVIAHLNINSIRNKLEPLKAIIENNLDILLISETKLDDSFPDPQFIIDGFSPPFRVNKDTRSGGLLLYVRDHILTKEININSNFSLSADSMQGICLEINFRNRKWFLFGGYNSQKKNIGNYLDYVEKILDSHMSKYDNFLIMGDFNSETNESAMMDFCSIFNLHNLVKEPTCFKNPQNPSSIDVMLTNRPKSFLRTITVETGISDHHIMTVTVLRSHIIKQAPTCIIYRDYKKFDPLVFNNMINYILALKIGGT